MKIKIHSKEAQRMKWKYTITYGMVKPGWTFEQLEKDMTKYKAEIEKKGPSSSFGDTPSASLKA